MNKKISIFGKKIRISHIILFVVMMIIAGIMIAPFLWVFSASLRPYSEAIALPPKWLPPSIDKWDMKYFKKLFSDSIPFFTFMKNSLKMSTLIICKVQFQR